MIAPPWIGDTLDARRVPLHVTTGPKEHVWSCAQCGPHANWVVTDADGVVVSEHYCPHEQEARR